MKPLTFINKLGARINEVMQGWVSHASFENAVQVMIDGILREHIAIPQDEEFMSDAGTGIKLRENAYAPGAQHSLVADILTTHVRPDKNNNLLLKETEYAIELKVESPQTHHYGGKLLKAAFDEDVGKLTAYRLASNEPKKRFWSVFVAISNANKAALATFGQFDHVQTFQGPGNTGMTVAVKVVA